MAQLALRTKAGGVCREELAMKRNAQATEQSTNTTLDKFGPHGGQPAAIPPCPWLPLEEDISKES
jgi:hypothetical protein